MKYNENYLNEILFLFKSALCTIKKKRWDLKILLHGNSKNFVFECQNNNFTITKQQ